jgi:hypothetical protein
LLKVVAEKLAQGSSLVELMGGTTDGQKLVSCLTLFERVAFSLNESEPSRDFAEVARRCTEILGRAEQQGYHRCKTTLDTEP